MANLWAEKVHKHLLELAIETPGVSLKDRPLNRQRHIAENIREALLSLGLDLDNDSLKKTPVRVARMFVQEVFYGLDYNEFPEISDFQNHYEYDEVIAHRCQVKSMCEHHLVPFYGTCQIGYIPKTRVLGLSKMNRIVDFFARRPQVQERLTEQISATLQLILDTDDVAVVIKATHHCIMLRGVKDETSETVTSKITGRFRSKPELRSEFFALSRNS